MSSMARRTSPPVAPPSDATGGSPVDSSASVQSPTQGGLAGSGNPPGPGGSTATPASGGGGGGGGGGGREHIHVAVRVKPMIAVDGTPEAGLPCLRVDGPVGGTAAAGQQVVLNNTRAFAFDTVFPPETETADVFAHVVEPLVVSGFMEGLNAAVMAYGQTGSGKTFTMTGCVDRSLKAMQPLFATAPASPTSPGAPDDAEDPKAGGAGGGGAPKPKGKRPAGKKPGPALAGAAAPEIRVGMLEVYNEQLFDLLAAADGNSAAAHAQALNLREDPKEGVSVVGQQSWSCSCFADLRRTIDAGYRSRTTAATLMNATSSRSHLVLTLWLRRRGISSKLHFVDLAGSERIKKSLGDGGGHNGADDDVSNAGDRLRECIAINSGLLALGNVITALCNNAGHVPFRSSKLTRVLQDSLAGNSRTALVACVSASGANFEETISTLKYAYRAKSLATRPVRVAAELTPAAAAEVIAGLRKELDAARAMLKTNGLALPTDAPAEIAALAANMGKAGGGGPSAASAGSASASPAPAAGGVGKAAANPAAVQRLKAEIGEAQQRAAAMMDELGREQRNTKRLEGDLFRQEFETMSAMAQLKEARGEIDALQKELAAMAATGGGGGRQGPQGERKDAAVDAGTGPVTGGGRRILGDLPSIRLSDRSGVFVQALRQKEGQPAVPQHRPAPDSTVSLEHDSACPALAAADQARRATLAAVGQGQEAAAAAAKAEELAARVAAEKCTCGAVPRSVRKQGADTAEGDADSGDSTDGDDAADAAARRASDVDDGGDDGEADAETTAASGKAARHRIRKLEAELEERADALESLHQACRAAEEIAEDYETRFQEAVTAQRKLEAELAAAMARVEQSGMEAHRQQEMRVELKSDYETRLAQARKAAEQHQKRLEEAKADLQRKARDRERTRRLQAEVQQLSERLKAKTEAATRIAKGAATQSEQRHAAEMRRVLRTLTEARQENARLCVQLQRKEVALQKVLHQGAAGATAGVVGPGGGFAAGSFHRNATSLAGSGKSGPPGNLMVMGRGLAAGGVRGRPAGRVGPKSSSSPTGLAGSGHRTDVAAATAEAAAAAALIPAGGAGGTAIAQALEAEVKALTKVADDIEHTKSVKARAALNLGALARDADDGRLRRAVAAWEHGKRQCEAALPHAKTDAEKKALQARIAEFANRVKSLTVELPRQRAQQEADLRSADDLLDSLHASLDFHVARVRMLQDALAAADATAEVAGAGGEDSAPASGPTSRRASVGAAASSDVLRHSDPAVPLAPARSGDD